MQLILMAARVGPGREVNVHRQEPGLERQPHRSPWQRAPRAHAELMPAFAIPTHAQRALSPGAFAFPLCPFATRKPPKAALASSLLALLAFCAGEAQNGLTYRVAAGQARSGCHGLVPFSRRKAQPQPPGWVYRAQAVVLLLFTRARLLLLVLLVLWLRNCLWRAPQQARSSVPPFQWLLVCSAVAASPL